MRKEGELFRYEKVNETGYGIMLNKSTLLFAALISATLPTIAQGAEKNSPNTQETPTTGSPTAADSNTRRSTVPAGLKGHFVVKSEDNGIKRMKDVEQKTSTTPAGLKGHFVVKSEDDGSGSVKDSNTRRSTTPAGLKGHFVIVSEDNGSGGMTDNKPEAHQK